LGLEAKVIPPTGGLVATVLLLLIGVAAAAVEEGIELEGIPCGFCNVITSSLKACAIRMRQITRERVAYFLNFTSPTKSLPSFMLSDKNTFPVVAIATMCECSLKGLNDIGSWISPVAFRE
jgi:hypothetical protein